MINVEERITFEIDCIIERNVRNHIIRQDVHEDIRDRVKTAFKIISASNNIKTTVEEAV